MALALDIPGMRSTLRAALVRPRPSLERIPCLKGIIANACEQMGEALAPIVADVEVSLLGIEEGYCRDHLGQNWHSELCALLISNNPAGEALVHFDAKCVNAVVLQAIGGRTPVDAALWPRTRLSRIETAIAKAISDRMGQALSSAFHNAGIALKLEPRDISDDQTVIEPARDNVPAIAVRLGFEGLATAAGVSILMPLSLIAPLAPRLADVPKPSAKSVVSGDPAWRRKIERELAQANIDVTAVLETRETTLEALAALKVGDMLALDATAESLVILESEDVALYACELGKQDGVLTVRVESKVGAKRAAPRPSTANAQSTAGAARNDAAPHGPVSDVRVPSL
jgi:flagellar motor switch protein FliM